MKEEVGARLAGESQQKSPIPDPLAGLRMTHGDGQLSIQPILGYSNHQLNFFQGGLWLFHMRAILLFKQLRRPCLLRIIKYSLSRRIEYCLWFLVTCTVLLYVKS